MRLVEDHAGALAAAGGVGKGRTADILGGGVMGRLVGVAVMVGLVLVGAPDARAYDCTGKDGEYCCGSSVCICDNGEWVFQDECLYGCEGAGPDANCKPKPFCVGKSNG